MRTYTLGGKLKLGDTWAFVSWLLQQKEVALTERTRSGRRDAQLKPLVMEIASLLDTTSSIAFVPGNRGERPPGIECAQHEFLRTKRQWVEERGRTICVQLDGRWMAHRKNPTANEEAALRLGLQAAGFTVKRIGLPMSLSECVTALSECYCFLGVDSGMMYLANSVRCPRILIRNRMFHIEQTYRGKGLIITESTHRAMELLV